AGGDRLAGPGVDGARAGERGVTLEHGDVRAVLTAVVAPALGDRIDPAEHPRDDLRPADPAETGVHPELRAAPGPDHQIGRIDEHLRRDAADVQAGAAEHALLDQRDRQPVIAFVEKGVAGSGTDHGDVEMLHRRASPSSTGASCRPAAAPTAQSSHRSNSAKARSRTSRRDRNTSCSAPGTAIAVTSAASPADHRAIWRT